MDESRALQIVALSRALALLDVLCGPAVGEGSAAKILADIKEMLGDHFTAGTVRGAECFLREQATAS